MKIGAVIVTYNPSIVQLKKNIDAVKNQVLKIVVVDNNSNNLKQVEKLLSDITNIQIIRLDRNYGIAFAQNRGFNILQKEYYDWVLTLDQDTVLPNDYVERIVKYLPICKQVGIMTGAYIDINWNEERKNKIKKVRHEKIENFNQDISSGNIVSIQAWKDVGGFDEGLFIDYVDFDFDYRLKIKQYNLYRVNDVTFEHEIGEPIKKGWVAKILGLDHKILFDHSAERLFYINRNRIIVRKRYPQFGSALGVFVTEVLALREIVLMKKPRWKKLQKSLEGILAGILYKAN